MILGIVIGIILGAALGLAIVWVARWQEIKPQRAAVSVSVMAVLVPVIYLLRLSPSSFRTVRTLEDIVELVVFVAAAVATVWIWYAIEQRQKLAG